MTESPFFFPRGPERLFAMLHEPEGGPGRTAFVMSHPFGEEKLWSHRVFVTFARALASRGAMVLRFDYAGAGDSSGDTAKVNLEGYVDDLRAALGTLQQRAPTIERVGLVGLRLGASVVARFLMDRASVQQFPQLRGGPLVLWDPVLDGEAYFQELLRINLSTQLAVYGKVQENREALVERIKRGGTANVDGYEIGLPLLESCGAVDFVPPGSKIHDGPMLVVQIAANDKLKDRDDLQRLAAANANAVFARAVEQPFWREIKPFYGRADDLQRVTLQWLEQHGV